MRKGWWVMVLFGVLSCLVLPLTVTAQDSEKGSAEALKKSAQGTLKAAKMYAEKEKQAYQKRMQSEIDALSSRLAQMKEKAKTAKGDALAKLNAGIADLEGKHKVAEQKLAELKSSSVEAWLKLKSGLDGAINQLKSSFQELSGDAK
jgi:uncharacterized protein YicC (UPF0701 family)